MILSNALKNISKLEKLGKILDFFCKHGITKSELDRLHDVTEGEEFGIISADRTELSNNKNKQRRTALVQDLNSVGLNWESTQGVWPVDTGTRKYDFENSFFVHDIDFGVIRELAKKYSQEAFIYKPKFGTVTLYNLDNGMAQVAIEYEVKTNMPVLRQQEEPEYMTRFRQTEVSYTWSEEVPFGNEPIYPEDVINV